ncbi:hypothetical protein IV49_GL000150 [Kandleria vitulina DSM 20405]|uniref:HTH lysR-type domain-containing protein n=1 Tax=Kandleria vitulina DSM 20405 TaxID=1410657 RepID=A0A0R2HPF8_9FIRM|nr:hypothetical protein IV49_GL000150 [Kandleria vitulina DSM 20405]
MEDFMEIKNLKYFLAVAREENMSRAAEQLHVSQPTLSKTLKALEEEAVYQAQLQYFTQ